MSRAYNFCAGPAALPTDVLEQARQEMLDYQGMGLSIMEMSHRDKVFVEIAE
ncbi:MAG: 3-phosphoserine/phosphohydroxythreonine transaminase, partial [Alcanivorax sp.]|nr:3-phosphoserine/phosphohydroxythreonine transaminase [Alcanivorax sp.]